MTAARLRTAAAKLREVAEGASEGPWRCDPEHKRDSRPADCYDVIDADTFPVVGSIEHADARYIATMNPPVALAVADLLDDLAGQSESCIAWDRERETGHLEWAREPAMHPDLTDALAVADAVLADQDVAV